MNSRVDCLFQPLRELRNRVGQKRRGAVRVERSKVVTGVIEKNVVSRTLGFRLPECLRALTSIVQDKGVID